MKMRKLFAGIAAAATLLGGMAFGVSSAQAEDAGVTNNESITVHNAQKGHTYKAYQFATFTNKKTEGNTTYVDVQTIDTMKKAVYLAADVANGNTVNVPDEYGKVSGEGDAADYSQTNPAAYVATFDAATLRRFSDALKQYLPADTAYKVEVTGESGSDATITGLPEGWYAVMDTKASDPNYAPAKQVAIVASTVKGADHLAIGEKEDGQQDIEKPGYVNAKNEEKPSGEKSSDKDNDAVGVGTEIKYTLTTHVRADYATAFDNFTVTFTDKPGTGLTVNKSNNFQINGKSIGTGANDVQATVTFPENKDSFDGDGNAAFTVTLTKDQIKKALEGQTAKNGYYTLQLSYTATVNKNAQGNINNTFNDGGADIDHTVKTGSFNLHKTGNLEGDADGLNDAKFKIYATKDGVATGDPLKFVETSDGTYRLAAEGETDTTTELATDTVNGTKGKLFVNGLASGTYVVKETDAPGKYQDTLLPEFKVTVTKDGFTFEADQLGLVDTTTHEVKNVKQITDLPITGAAGTALFTIVGLLLAGAAVTVLAKSRATKRQLMA